MRSFLLVAHVTLVTHLKGPLKSMVWVKMDLAAKYLYQTIAVYGFLKAMALW